MPLDWLGQLKPTMQQIIALQKALMALSKTAEGTEKRPTGALTRGLGEVKPYAGPTSAFAKEPAFKGGMEYEPVTRAPLARALAPTTEGRPDWQAEAWAKREEMAGEQVADAKGLYDRLLPLSDEGRNIALTAARKYKPEVVKAMEKEGYISPDGTLSEPEEVKKPMTRDTHVEDGWLYEDVLFDDGTSTHTIIGRAEEVEVEGATVSEIINAQKLGIDIEQHEERFYRDAIRFAGDIPRIGIDMVTEADGKERVAEQKDVDAWKTNVNNLIKFFRESSGTPSAGAPTMEEVKSMYEGKPDLISDVQRKLGMTVTGVWDDALEEAFKAYGGVE